MSSEKLSQAIHNLSKEQLEMAVHELSKDDLEKEIISLAREVDRLQGMEQRVEELTALIQRTPILKVKARDTDADTVVTEQESLKESAAALINLARVNKS